MKKECKLISVCMEILLHKLIYKEYWQHDKKMLNKLSWCAKQILSLIEATESPLEYYLKW